MLQFYKISGYYGHMHKPMSLFFLSEQPFPNSHTNCKIGLQRIFFALVLNRPKITYQPYPGIYTICTSVKDVFYTTWH